MSFVRTLPFFAAGVQGRPSSIHSLIFSESVVETHRKCVLHRDLHPVVFRRVVRCRNLYGCLETVVRSAEIYHRSRAQAEVAHVGTGIGYPFNQVIVYFPGGKAAVPADEDFPDIQQSGKEIPDLVSGRLVEIHIVDSSDVIRVKCSHGYASLVLYLVETLPFDMFASFLAIIFFLIGATRSTNIFPSRWSSSC